MAKRLFVMRQQPHVHAGYHTPGYPWMPLLFLVPTAGLLVLLVLEHPLRSLLGVVVVLMGVPAYHLAFRRRLQNRGQAASLEDPAAYVREK